MAKNVTTATRTVNLVEARQAIEVAMGSGEHGRPCMVWGPPGIGKSDLAKKIGADWSVKGKSAPRNIIDVRLPLWDPTDIKGIPFFNPETKSMEWASPAEFPAAANVNDTSIIFLDEINGAAPAVQMAAYQLILDRKVGTYKLPDGVSILAAGNRAEDGGVTYKMPDPLKNRFTHLYAKCEFEPWLEWALENKIHADIIGYLSHAKGNLYKFNPRTSGDAFETPRSWSFASEYFHSCDNDAILMDLIAGTVGEGTAGSLMAHRKVAKDMPNPTDILNGKVKTLHERLKNEVSAQYSLTTNMCYEMKEMAEKMEKTDDAKWHKMADCFFQFMMENFGTEVTVMGAKTALTTFKLPFQPGKLKSFDKFHKKYGKLVIAVMEE